EYRVYGWRYMFQEIMYIGSVALMYIERKEYAISHLLIESFLIHATRVSDKLQTFASIYGIDIISYKCVPVINVREHDMQYLIS
ncbi:hypothetical protein ACJX0J_012166, partial [Zea mays]